MVCITWRLSTDVEEQRKDPYIELALGGVARDLVREIDLQIKIHVGIITADDGGQQQLTGGIYTHPRAFRTLHAAARGGQRAHRR